MSIRIDTFKLVYYSVDMQAIDPQYLGLSREKLEKYFESHAKVDDPNYSNGEIISDLSESSGFYSIPRKTSVETENYIIDMLEELT